MLKTNLLLALRQFNRRRFSAFINVFGLSLGLASFALIVLYVRDEWSFDRHNRDAGRIVRVVKDFVNDDGSRVPDATTPPALLPTMTQEIPDIEAGTRVMPPWGFKPLLSYADKHILAEDFLRVDSTFFDVFTVQFLRGDAKNCFAQPRSIVLTERMAQKFFGNDDPIGKIMRIHDQADLQVSAVVANPPAQSHFDYDFLMHIRSVAGDWATNYRMDGIWGWYNFYTYVKLQPGVTAAQFEPKVRDLFKRRGPKESTNFFYTQPLTGLQGIHLASNLKWELAANGDARYLWIFGSVALFVLLIAGVNYVNLATARSAERAREVGIRKAAGARHNQLIRQFLSESTLTAVFALLLGIGLATIAMPFFNQLTDKDLTLFTLESLPVWATVIAAAALYGLAAGLYPAFHLSRFQPAPVLKGDLRAGTPSGTSNQRLRQGLVILQFTISVFLIVGVLAVQKQLQFIQNSRLGFDKEQVVVLRNVGELPGRAEPLRQAMLQIPGVRLASVCDGMVGGQNWTNNVNRKGSEEELLLNFLNVGYDYLPALGLELKEGRNFSPDFPSDSIDGLILNETAVKQLRLAEPVLGQQIQWGRMENGDPIYCKLVGVVRDFHFTSLRSEIKAFGFAYTPDRVTEMVLKMSGDDPRATLAQIEKTWASRVPAKPIDYYFLDDAINKLYVAETNFGTVIGALTVLGILIACLGLFGLAAFTAQQRTKEIGIRKVLGATTRQITALLASDFMRLVLVAVVLGIPLAWWAMQRWLQDFAYRTSIGWGILLFAGLVAMAIAFLTVSFQSIKAALANPVKSLRSE